MGAVAANADFPSRHEAMAKARGQGHGIVAVLPFHYPRALLRAHRLHPVEIWGPPDADPDRDDAHFQEYTCGIVRNATDRLKHGLIERVDGILVPHTCDSLQGMGTVFQTFVRPPCPVWTLYHPRGRRPSDLEFLIAELKSLSAKLAGLSGGLPDDEALRAAISAEDTANHAFSKALAIGPGIGESDRAFYGRLRAREYLSAEDFVAAMAGRSDRGANSTRPGVFLGGIVPEPMALFDLLAELGARVAGDDLACCGRRVYGRFDDADPYRALALQMMSMPPDPTLGSPIDERNRDFLRRVRQSGARGVLIYGLKFCEPEALYLPLLRDALREAGYPFLHVETELTEEIPEPVRNRIAAFIEVLR